MTEMAPAARCSTPGAVYTTRITPTSVSVTVDMPHTLDLQAEDAAHLETTLHNAVEMALAPLFVRAILDAARLEEETSA